MTDRYLRVVSTLPRACVLVRTWFGDDDAWRRLVAEVRTPSEDGFLATVICVDDVAFEGLTADELAAAQANDTFVSFIADERTLTGDELPILAVLVLRGGDDSVEHRPFRVVPPELWGVENNINLANMDWDDFAGAVDEDGVFRGF